MRPIRSRARAHRTASAALLVAVVVAAVMPASPARAQPAGLDRLAWLAGCWRVEGSDGSQFEHWLAPAAGSMVGLSRQLIARAAPSLGFMQIREASGGGLVLVSWTPGRPEAIHPLVQAGDAAVAFENEGADFPQRVALRLDSAGRLQQRREGPAGAAVVETVLVRAACDAMPPAPEAFQGLGWGASEAQIALRFGAGLTRADCPSGGRGGLRPREACDHPVLPRYEVAGIPFRLALHLDERARQLVRVALSHAVQTDGAEAGWGEKHRVLRQLLTQRYGAPESTHVDTEGGAQRATARWRRGDTLIELSSGFQPRGAGSRASESVEIVYQPVHAGEAGKL